MNKPHIQNDMKMMHRTTYNTPTVSVTTFAVSQLLTSHPAFTNDVDT